MNEHTRANKLISILSILVITMSALLLSGCNAVSGGNEAEKQINTLDDLNGKNICAVMGTINAVELIKFKKLQDSEILYATDENDATQKIVAGKADAFVTDSIYANRILAEYQDAKILDEHISDSSFGIAFPKNSPFIEEINASLSELKQDGTLDEIIEKWMALDLTGVKVVPNNVEDSKGTWHVAIDTSFKPITFVDADGNFQGMDVDLINTIANRNGYNVKYTDIDFSEILSNVAANNYDLSVSGITITEDRQRIVDFSEPYFNNSTIIIVKDYSNSFVTTDLDYRITNSLHRVFIENDNYKLFLSGLRITLIFVLVTIILSNIFGFLLYLWVYSGSWIANKIGLALRKLIELMPAVIWLYVVYYLLFAGQTSSGVVSGVIALTIISASMAYTCWDDAIVSINIGQKEAAYVMGYGKYQALFKIYLPQGLTRYFKGVNIYMIDLVKNTALVELVAVFDITAASDLVLAQTNVPFIPVIIPAVVYVVIAFVITKLFSWFEKKTAERIDDPVSIEQRILRG